MNWINRVALTVIITICAGIVAQSQTPDRHKLIVRRTVFGDFDHSLAFPRVEGTPGQKDPSAVAAIRRFLLATGAAQWSGFSGSGNISAGRGEEKRQGNAELAIQANDWARFDIHYPSGTRSIRLMGPVGGVLQEDGTILQLPAETAISGIVILPNILFSVIEDKDAAFIDGGIAEVEGARLQKITVVRQLPNASASPASLLQPVTATLLFDPTSGFLRKSVDVLLYPGAINTKHLRVVTYDDYRGAEGIVFPYRFTETIDGLPSWTLTLTSASVNSSHQSTYFRF